MEYILKVDILTNEAFVIDTDTHKVRNIAFDKVKDVLKKYNSVVFASGITRKHFSDTKDGVYSITYVGGTWYFYNRGWYFSLDSENTAEFIRDYLINDNVLSNLLNSLGTLDIYFEYKKRLYAVFDGMYVSLHSNGKIYIDSGFAGTAREISEQGFKRISLLS